MLGYLLGCSVRVAVSDKDSCCVSVLGYARSRDRCCVGYVGYA